MRFHLKHWFLLMAITEGFMVSMLYTPLRHASGIEYEHLLKFLLIGFPIILTILLLAYDGIEKERQSSENKWLDQQVSNEKLARKIIKTNNHRILMFMKDTILVYLPSSYRPVVLKNEDVLFLAKQINDLNATSNNKT